MAGIIIAVIAAAAAGIIIGVVITCAGMVRHQEEICNDYYIRGREDGKKEEKERSRQNI